PEAPWSDPSRIRAIAGDPWSYGIALGIRERTGFAVAVSGGHAEAIRSGGREKGMGRQPTRNASRGGNHRCHLSAFADCTRRKIEMQTIQPGDLLSRRKGAVTHYGVAINHEQVVDIVPGGRPRLV